MIIALLMISIVAYCYDITLFYIVGGISGVVLLLSAVNIAVGGYRIDNFVSDMGESIASAQADTLLNMPIPVIVTDEKGEILWYNDNSREHLLVNGEWYGRKIQDVIGKEQSKESKIYT